MTAATKPGVISDGITHTRNVILRGMSTIYFIAFVSFYYQSTGKFDSNTLCNNLTTG